MHPPAIGVETGERIEFLSHGPLEVVVQRPREQLDDAVEQYRGRAVDRIRQYHDAELVFLIHARVGDESRIAAAVSDEGQVADSSLLEPNSPSEGATLELQALHLAFAPVVEQQVVSEQVCPVPAEQVVDRR